MKKVLFAATALVLTAAVASADTTTSADPPTLMISAECQIDAYLTLASVDLLAPQIGAEHVDIAKKTKIAPPVHDLPGIFVMASIDTIIAPPIAKPVTDGYQTVALIDPMIVAPPTPEKTVGVAPVLASDKSWQPLTYPDGDGAPVTLASWPIEVAPPTLGDGGTAIAPMTIAATSLTPAPTPITEGGPQAIWPNFVTA